MSGIKGLAQQTFNSPIIFSDFSSTREKHSYTWTKQIEVDTLEQCTHPVSSVEGSGADFGTLGGREGFLLHDTESAVHDSRIRHLPGAYGSYVGLCRLTWVALDLQPLADSLKREGERQMKSFQDKLYETECNRVAEERYVETAIYDEGNTMLDKGVD